MRSEKKTFRRQLRADERYAPPEDCGGRSDFGSVVLYVESGEDVYEGEPDDPGTRGRVTRYLRSGGSLVAASSEDSCSSYHIGVAAEAFAAGLFARLGHDVSVQYGANQPEYDLIVAHGERMMKVSVKGSKERGWGLTQSYLRNADYGAAVDLWLGRHNPRTIFCFVQFYGVAVNAMPRVYLATPAEVAKRLKESAGGRGDTILHENYTWGARAAGRGTVDCIPAPWTFSAERVWALLEAAG